MALIVGVEGFFFTYLEQWYTKSFSARSYMLKRSIRRSLAIVAIAAVVIFLVLTPFMADAIANSTSEVGKTHDNATFMSRDPLGLTSVQEVHLVSASVAQAIVLSQANYVLCAGDVDLMRQYAVASTTDTSPGVNLEFPAAAPFGEYYIVVISDRPVEVSFTVHRAISSSFVAFVTLFATLFIGIYVAWVVFATKVRGRYTKGAAYK
jgi:ABC-type Fe3+ transport system permease subunit